MVDGATASQGMGIFGTVVRSTELLVFIIKTIDEAHHLKEECGEIRSAASTLMNVLRSNPQALQDIETDQMLMRTLDKVKEFTLECRDENIVRRAWEVTWTKQLPALMKEMLMWIACLGAEVSITLRREILQLLANVEELKAARHTDNAIILGKLGIVEELTKALRDESISGFHIEFPDNDTRLVIREVNGRLIGKLRPRQQDLSEVNIVCDAIDESPLGMGQKPRHAFIYAKLSARILVQPFYGIAQRQGRKWAIIADFADHKSLYQTICEDELIQDIAGRIEIARHIARTVNYLHSVDILVKVLSDKNIVLQQDREGIKPYLIGLENSRLFLEDSVGGTYDVRYEAPELYRSGGSRRDVHSDIWSLGILIWQCASGEIPYSTLSSSRPGANSNIEEIRMNVARNRLPWTGAEPETPFLKQVLQVVKSCCNPKPDARPSAAQVEQQLSRILHLAPMLQVVADAEDIKSAATSKLDKDSEGRVRNIPLSDDEVQALRTLLANGDAHAGYLLGKAIHQDQAPADDDAEQLLLVPAADVQNKERRFRSAIALMEVAMRAEIKPAAHQLMLLHFELARLYQSQAQQYKDLQSFSSE